ncbi:thiamine-phosphate kinase [Bdellovibrio sp. HCB337]|uniref:thiamine-phosphate kinase n=1 Tax=Bdellovibrio sp. HCB337 TaxID=3394358 RepID=UPI0039A44689
MLNTPREHNLIQKLKKLVSRHHSNTLVPLGDDAFVFKNFTENTVVAQDMMIEDVHFKTSYFSPTDLGYKALAVNLSDLAAMGALPHFAQVSLGLPKDVSEDWILSFYSGMLDLADQYQMEIVGGDLCRSPGPVIVDVSVIGEVKDAFTRNGVQDGDWLAVTGPLGLSHTGRLALEKELYIYAEAMQKHLRPKPRLDVVQILKQHQVTPQTVHGLMDCSDGLINDLLHLTRRGVLGVELNVPEIPIDSDTLGMAASLQQKALDWALWGGEDYELLLAFPKNKKDELKYIFESADLDLFFIGQFNDTGKITLKNQQGEIEEITEFKGWSHF